MDFEQHLMLNEIYELSKTSLTWDGIISAIAVLVVGYLGWNSTRKAAEMGKEAAHDAAKLGVEEGAKLALENFKREQFLLREKEKIFFLNQIFDDVETAYRKLIGLKKNYYYQLVEIPEQYNVDNIKFRYRLMPNDCTLENIFDENVSKFSFILRIVPENSEWLDLKRIKLMFLNYNTLKDSLDIRRQLCDLFYEDLKNYDNLDEIIKNTNSLLEGQNKADLLHLIERTENSINMIDHLIVEMRSFLTGFPSEVRRLLDEEAVQLFGPVYGFVYSGISMAEFHKKTPKIKLNKLCKLTGRDLASQKKVIFW